MLLFGNKLIAAKKPKDDGPAGEEEESANGSSLISAQKEAISTLSKHEKLLLLELQRTRLNIVQELQDLDPQLSAGSWKDVQAAIEVYQNKITAVAQEETVDGQRASDKFSLESIGGRSSSPNKHHPAHHGQGQGATLASTNSAEVGKYSSATSHKRTKLVNTAAQIPVSRIRTGVDMLPVLVSTGLTETDIAVRRQLPIRIPVFKLPEIDPSRVTQVLAEKDAAGIPASLQEKKIVDRSAATHSSSAHGARTKRRYKNNIDYMQALAKNFANLQFTEKAFLLGALSMSVIEWGTVQQELEHRVQLRISCDTSDVADPACPSVFLWARRVKQEGGPRGAGAGAGAFGPNSSHNNNSSSSSGLNVGEHNFSMASMSIGGGGGGASKHMMAQHSNLNGGDSIGMFSSTSASSKFTKSRRGQALKGGGATKGVKDRMEDSMHRSQSTSALLKTELLDSLRSMQQHTVGVKSGIASIQGLVNIDNPRARIMIFNVAAEKMSKALKTVVLGELQRGWLAWQTVNVQLRRIQCAKRVTRLLGLRILSEKLNAGVCGVIEKKYSKWVNYTRRESQRIIRARQIAATTEIQRHMRVFLARKRVRYLKEQIKYRRLYAAVLKIQALIRGKLTRWKYLKFMLARKQEASAIKIQKRFRGHRGRRRVRVIRFQRNKVLAATRIQSVVRGRQGRNRYKTFNKERIKMRAAVKVQSCIRGFLARRTIHRILERRKQEGAVLVIQARWRGAICRMSMGRKRKEIQEYKETRLKAAVSIQKVFRGWKSRMSTRILQIEKERRNRKFGIAATKINCMIRCFLSRAIVRDKRKQHFNKLLDDARTWKETWAEDSEAWFYLNSITGEDLWQPPASGYTKNDGTLVLATGANIEDPVVAEANETERKKNTESLCCECEERVAIKYCRKCGDRYCTPCYRASHATGSRRKHTAEPVGPIDCSECEIVLCVRWCVSCDEAYCDNCWRKVHSKGKRRFHPFCEVTAKGRIDTRQFTMDGTEVESYDATYAQQMVDSEETSQVLNAANAEFQQYTAEQTNYAAQWETYQDENGADYYYNNVTGETTYDSPF